MLQRSLRRRMRRMHVHSRNLHQCHGRSMRRPNTMQHSLQFCNHSTIHIPPQVLKGFVGKTECQRFAASTPSVCTFQVRTLSKSSLCSSLFVCQGTCGSTNVTSCSGAGENVHTCLSEACAKSCTPFAPISTAVALEQVCHVSTIQENCPDILCAVECCVAKA